MVIEEVDRVAFVQGRFYLEIEVIKKDETRERFIASADAGITDLDCIWFGTADEYHEELDRRGF